MITCWAAAARSAAMLSGTLAFAAGETADDAMQRVGQLNQLYFDQTGSNLYYCAGESGGTYVWLGTSSITVDSSLSGSSTNPVQNKVITARVGTGALPNSNTNLTDAINYVNGRIPAAATTVPEADTTSGAVGTGTAFARNDHRHPLNVPTSGVPAALGTAALGNNSTYAKSDHVHPMPSASDVGALSATDVQYKIYNSVTDLGLTSGSATIAGAWNAMPDSSILLCPNGDFAGGEVPNIGGYVEIKKQSIVRGVIFVYAKTSERPDYRMHLNDSNVPDGKWMPAFANDVSADGIITFPNGLIVAWGTDSVTTGTASSGAFAYRGSKSINLASLGFSTVLSAFANVADSAGYWNAQVSGINNSSITVSAGGNQNATKTVHWLAIGI